MASDVCFAPDFNGRRLCFWCLHPPDTHPVWPCVDCQSQSYEVVLDGQVDCDTCDGTGYQAHHDGWHPCEDCHGHRIDFRGDPCTSCGGHGWNRSN